MIRISRHELVNRWAMTYGEDGYEVRALDVAGLVPPGPVGPVMPDIEATKPGGRVLVQIIDSLEALDAPRTRYQLRALDAARSSDTRLHLVVAAECMEGLKDRMQRWNVRADVVHVT
jgi:hypothetical protein